MTTDELLEKATARPWEADPVNPEMVRKKKPDAEGACQYVAGFPPEATTDVDTTPQAEYEANAALTVRALNSFEAMREALEKALPHMQHLADVERTGCDHLPDSGCDTDCMSECYLSRDIVAVHKALKLADGEA